MRPVAYLTLWYLSKSSIRCQFRALNYRLSETSYEPHLEEAWDLAAERAVYLINRYRDSIQNLRTQL